MQKGKFFVIEGVDGSGKATQTKMLADVLKKRGYKVKTIDFPQYTEESACLVKSYLAGDYGTVEDVGPYKASIFYAIDRYAASFKVREWLLKNYIVIADRYVSSNKGHQLSKIEDRDEALKYLKWINNFEYNIMEIPRPDMTLFLNVPVEISQKKAIESTKTKVKGDIHEKDTEHLRKALNAYLFVIENDKEECWKNINCIKDGAQLSVDDVHKKIIKIFNTQY